MNIDILFRFCKNIRYEDVYIQEVFYSLLRIYSRHLTDSRIRALVNCINVFFIF